MLHGVIINFSYQKCWMQSLPCVNFTDINDLPSKCLVNFNGKNFALSKWVSPKRTRSYPYARVYDTFSSSASKVVTIIPLIKDEGASGDMDYLQWDTLSLMSLLNVYVIIAFYDEAQPHPKYKDKITQQKLNNEYILEQLNKLCDYHQSALHFNLNQLSAQNLSNLTNLAKNAYINLSKSLNIMLHNPQNIDKFATKITQNKDDFISFSRDKAKRAQNAESLTTQPKEHIGVGQKGKIIIENYLGGQYFFTIDDIFLKNDILHLCESKHSKSALLPSSDDIKDGLLKLMLYNNLAKIQGFSHFKVVLRLTSSALKANFKLPNSNLNAFIAQHKFSSAQQAMLNSLNKEASNNNFEIWINDEN